MSNSIIVLYIKPFKNNKTLVIIKLAINQIKLILKLPFSSIPLKRLRNIKHETITQYEGKKNTSMSKSMIQFINLSKITTLTKNNYTNRIRSARSNPNPSQLSSVATMQN